jgi:acyl carrier protein
MDTTMDSTESRIRRIVSQIADLPPDVPADANLYLDLGVASVHAMQLLVGLEDGFAVQVPDEEFVEATSISELTAMIDRLLDEKSGEAERA